MYYSDMQDYVGDYVTVFVDGMVIQRKLKAGFKIRHDGQDIPVKLNAWKSGFIKA